MSQGQEIVVDFNIIKSEIKNNEPVEESVEPVEVKPKAKRTSKTKM